uniref:Cytokinin-O-glucosyltransferase 2 n=1 Tax=Aegilops tauschii subsp. strangulata TaxID=200361 RepID=A0A453JK32_AEGTS
MATQEIEKAPHAVRRRVVLFPLPFQGHLSPMLQLAELLRARGLAVTVLHTDFNAPDPARHPELAFVSIHEALPHEATSPDADIVAQLLALNSGCEAPFREALASLLLLREDVACVVVDGQWYAALGAAGALGVPVLALRTDSAATFGSLLAFPRLRDAGYVPIKGKCWCELIEFVRTQPWRERMGRLMLEKFFCRRGATGRRARAGAGAAPRARPHPHRRQRRGRAARLHRPRRRRRAGLRVRGSSQLVRRHRGAGAGQDRERAVLSSLRGRPSAQDVPRAGAGGARPARARPPLPGVAGRAPAALRAVREPGERRSRRPRRVRGNGVGTGGQRRAVPVGRPARLRPRRRRRRTTQRARRGIQEQGEGGGMGATTGGSGPRGRRRILDALRLELDAGGRVRRRADARAAVLRGPDGEREVRDAPVGRRAGGGGRDRQGQGRGEGEDGDGRGRRGSGEGEGASAQAASRPVCGC